MTRRMRATVSAAALVVAGALVPPAALAAGDRLVDAAARRDATAVRALLDQRVDVNASDADGSTALQWAAHWDDVTLVERLLGAGADANRVNELGVGPLALASANRNARMVRLLLGAGADPNRAAQSGETVLMTAARAGSADVVSALLDRKADPAATERHHGQTALMWAVAAGHTDVVKLLIARGADVNARSLSSFSPLLFAAQQGDVAAVRELLGAGARIDDRAKDGSTPLFIASASLRAATGSNYKILPRPSDHESVALLLLEKGADVSLADSYGRTPLHVAAETGKRTLVAALLAKGANPNARLTKGLPYRPGDYVTRGNFTGATPLWYAARRADAELITRLVAAGADPNLGTEDNTTPLMAVVGMGEPDSRLWPEPQVADAIDAAVRAGADVNAVHKRSGQSALHVAASLGRTELIRRLAIQGAKLDLADRQGQTPLKIAENPNRPRKEAAELLNTLMARQKK